MDRLSIRKVLVVSSFAALLALAGFATTAGTAQVEAATRRCTPGYSPCISLKSSDVDCYGGSGNGPRYTRRGVVYNVRRGYDRYGLDSDHDGKGCE